MVRALAVALLLLAGTVNAETFRFFGSGGAEAQLTPANQRSPLNPRNIAAIPLHTNAGDITTFADAVGDSRRWKVRMKVRGDASDRGSDQLRVGEGFLQLSPRPWLDVTIGRVIDKWGSAYAWNPTAFVSPRKNPTDPGDRRSAYRGVDMVKADLFVHDTNISVYAMQHRAFAARVYRLIANTDVSVHVRHDPGTTREGISVARVFGDALEIHGEVARVDGERKYMQAVAGAQYTFPSSINVVLELYHGGDGMSGAEWRAFCDSIEPATLRVANAQYAPLKMGRDYSFLRVEWRGAELIAIANLRDRSSLARITLSRKIRPNLSAYLIETEFFGAGDAEFAYIQIRRTTTFGMRYHF